MTARGRAFLVAAVVVFGATTLGMQAVAKQERNKKHRSGLVIAATRIQPPVDGKDWAIHVINATPRPIESILLEEVSYEWGDDVTSKPVGVRFGPLAPAASVEIWREDNPEVRTSVHLVVRVAAGTRRLMAEFPVLQVYMRREPVLIPILGRKGYISTELYWDPV
jgi:hypothetical protein